MRLRAIAFAATMLLASAAFTASFADSGAVSEKTFDWIFFAIVGIPFLLGLAVLFIEGKGSIRHDREQTPGSWPPFTDVR